jgi:hypothetical protein
MLYIINKNTNNSEIPNILSTWYLNRDGNLTQDKNDNVRFPTRHKAFVYDNADPDKPTYLEVARSELSSQNYAHEISFDIRKDNKLIDIKDLEIGKLVDIVYNDTMYKSVLTGYVYNPINEFMTLRFGHVRSTMQSMFDDDTI